MQKNKKYSNQHSNHNKSKGKPQFQKKSTSHSLLERISYNLPNDKENQISGKIVITKLNDFVENKCHYGHNCAHLRAQAKCQYLHEKKDYQFLHIQLPEKYLQNQQPLKKSKQQRKQDKIKQKAERQQRLKQKLQRDQKPTNEQRIQQQQQLLQKQHQQKQSKPIKQKQMDQKQLLIQQLLKPQPQQSPLTLQHIYNQLNLLQDAYTYNSSNKYSQNFNLQKINISMFQIRKRLFMKFKKNKQYEVIQKKFMEKEQGFVKKLIKNILIEYKDQIQQIKQAQKCESLDLRQIYQDMEIQKINKVLRSKKQIQSIIQYYSRFLNVKYGYPISFEINQQDKQTCSVHKGNTLPLKQLYLLTLISPNYEFQRVFVSLNITYSQLKAISQFSSLLIPHRVLQKQPVQKAFTLDIMNTSYTKFIEQIMTQYLSQYHQKLKPPSQFTFGKLEENLKKMRNFLAKYKIKVQSQNKSNSFIFVVYNIKNLLKRIEELNMKDMLNYDKIKKDRTVDQQGVYEKVFILKEFIKIMGEGSLEKIKVVYVNNGKKLKLKKYKQILEIIDQGLKDKEQKKDKIQEQEQEKAI